MRPQPRLRPSIEALDARVVLSSGVIPGTIGVGIAQVPTPHAVGRVAAVVAPGNLAAHRRSTIFGVAARPIPGSALDPRPLFATGPGGQRLPFQPGAPYRATTHPDAIAYTKNNRPGTMTTGLTGRDDTTGTASVRTYLPGDVNGDGKVDLADLWAFAPTFGLKRGQPGYNPAADANQNGQIGQGDALIILRNMTPLTPKIPLKVEVHLVVPDQAVGGHLPVDSNGGVTRKHDVTIIGHTTPGAMVFLDGPRSPNYRFEEKAIPTDARGFFRFSLHLDAQFTNTEYLVIDPYGQQTIKALPLRLVE